MNSPTRMAVQFASLFHVDSVIHVMDHNICFACLHSLMHVHVSEGEVILVLLVNFKACVIFDCVRVCGCV